MVVRLILLGILSHNRRPIHGYDIKSKLKEWAVGEYAPLSYGSIYYNLERMENEGLVTSRVVKNGKRPERKLYSITEKGESELMSLLRKNYFEIERPFYPFDIGVSMFKLMPKGEVMEALNKRIGVAKEHIDMGLREKAQLEGRIPFFALAIINHYLYHFEAEKKWLEGLMGEVEKWQGLRENDAES